MAAIGGKADVNVQPSECLQLARTGHSNLTLRIDCDAAFHSPQTVLLGGRPNQKLKTPESAGLFLPTSALGVRPIGNLVAHCILRSAQVVHAKGHYEVRLAGVDG